MRILILLISLFSLCHASQPVNREMTPHEVELQKMVLSEKTFWKDDQQSFGFYSSENADLVIIEYVDKSKNRCYHVDSPIASSRIFEIPFPNISISEDWQEVQFDGVKFKFSFSSSCSRPTKNPIPAA